MPDFIVSKQYVRITLFFFTTFLWPMASAFLFYTPVCLLRYNFSFYQLMLSLIVTYNIVFAILMDTSQSVTSN